MGGSALEALVRHGGAGVSRYSLNLGGGAQTSRREKRATTTLLSLSPMTVAGPRPPGGPPAWPGGDRAERGQVGGPSPAPAMCAPPKSRAAAPRPGPLAAV